MFARAGRLVAYLLSFALARGGLFVAPIVLANLLPAADYGTLELAHALASVGATLLALGTSAAVPLVLVRKVETASWGGVLLHQVVIGAVLLTLAVLFSLAGSPRVVWLTCLCTAALLLQALWSVVLKSYGRGEASLLLDTGFWGTLAIAALLSAVLLSSPPQRGAWVLAMLIAYLAALAGWTVARFLRAGPRAAAGTYVATVRTGLPLMVVALLAFLATTSGRIGVGLLSTPELTADYAVLFRATALPIVAHQIIMVAQFRQVFELPIEQLERKLPWVVALVVASVAAFWILSGPLGWLLGPAFESAFERHRAEGLLILTQCILWSAIALNDLVNTRSLTAGTVARWTALYFAVVLPLAWIYLLARPAELSVFVPVHSAVMAGYFATQAAVMWRCGIQLRRAWALTLLAFVALSALTYIL
jgi:O-antigen/teichoic acid export membrane protein